MGEAHPGIGGALGVRRAGERGSLEELTTEAQRLRQLPSVSEVDSALLFIPKDQPQKLKIIGDFAELVGPVRIGRPTPVDVARLVT